MAKSKFLNDLKKAVDDGEFNSDAAKKINEIDKEANNVSKNKSQNELRDLVNKRVEESGTKTVDKEQVAELNTKYEREMQERAKEEKIYATIATLENFDYQIDNVIDELKMFIFDLKKTYDSNDEKCEILFQKINGLIDKYKLNFKED